MVLHVCLNLDPPAKFGPGSGSRHANTLLSRENTTYRGSGSSAKKGIRWMRVSHSFPAISAVFDDPNLVSCAGLAPTLALAQRAGLADLVAHTLTLKALGGVNAHLKVPSLVAGMVAGADSIDDMDLLRHGGMGRLCVPRTLEPGLCRRG